MSTIYELVADALDTLNPAVLYALAPYKSSTTALPDTFITYQLVSGIPEQHADNGETERSYLVQVTIWSRGGLVSLPDVPTAMIAAGFIKSAERQLPQADTGHYGVAEDYVYLD